MNRRKRSVFKTAIVFVLGLLSALALYAQTTSTAQPTAAGKGKATTKWKPKAKWAPKATAKAAPKWTPKKKWTPKTTAVKTAPAPPRVAPKSWAKAAPKGTAKAPIKKWTPKTTTTLASTKTTNAAPKPWTRPATPKAAPWKAAKKKAPLDPPVQFNPLEKGWIHALYSRMPASERPRGWPQGYQMDPGTPHLEPGDKFAHDAEVVPFPRDLDRRMAFDPPSVKRGFYKGYALVYNADTQVVLDAYQLFPFAPTGTLAASR